MVGCASRWVSSSTTALLRSSASKYCTGQAASVLTFRIIFIFFGESRFGTNSMCRLAKFLFHFEKILHKGICIQFGNLYLLQ